MARSGCETGRIKTPTRAMYLGCIVDENVVFQEFQASHRCSRYQASVETAPADNGVGQRTPTRAANGPRRTHPGASSSPVLVVREQAGPVREPRPRGGGGANQAHQRARNGHLLHAAPQCARDHVGHLRSRHHLGAGDVKDFSRRCGVIQASDRRRRQIRAG